jgi:hypothetical protein
MLVVNDGLEMNRLTRSKQTQGFLTKRNNYKKNQALCYQIIEILRRREFLGDVLRKKQSRRGCS